MLKWKSWGFLGLLVASLSMVACGGGDDGFSASADDGGGGVVTPAPIIAAGIRLVAESAILSSEADSADQGIQLTAIAVDENNIALPGVLVSFTADSGVVVVSESFTDSNGTVSAILHTGGNPVPRIITVSAVSGSQSQSLSITVQPPSVGGGPTGPPVATVAINASAPQMPSTAATANSPGAVTVTAFVRDAANNGIAGVDVAFAATSGQLAAVQATTDENGQATAILTTGGSPALRSITVTASAGGRSASTQVQVVADVAGGSVAFLNLTSSAPNLLATASDPADGVTLTAVALASGNVPVPGVTVNFSTSAGALANVNNVTDANGRATAVLTTGGVASLPASITVNAAVGTLTAAAVIQVVNPVNPVASITLSTSSPELPSGASSPDQGISISALIRDSNGNLVPGIPVTFSAPGAGIQVTQNVTDDAGIAIGVLTNGGDKTNRVVNVSASAGGITSNVLPIAVTGTTLQINGPPTVGADDIVEYQVSVTDSTGAGVPQTPVSVSSALGNPITNGGQLSTDLAGNLTFNYTGSNPGNDVITAISPGVTSAINVLVVNDKISFLSPGAGTAIAIGSSRQFVVSYQQAGQPVANANISFVTTRGDFDPGTAGNQKTALAVTNAQGQASVNLGSNGDDGVGGALVTAQVQPDGPSVTLPVTLVSDVADSVDIQASPTNIPASGKSTIRAIVRDENNNFVSGAAVNFFIDDVSSGTLSAATGVTNSLGAVSVDFNASASSSGTDDVRITAQVANNPTVQDSVDVTVGGQALFITLGTGNVIRGDDEGPGTTYQLPFAAIITDAAGNPAPPNTVFRLSIVSIAYQKGALDCDPVTEVWFPVYTVAGNPGGGDISFSFGDGCFSEDVNTNGILDPGEDVNRNGRLEPGNVAVVPDVSAPGVVPLENGVAQFEIEYPQDRANWVRVSLRATATVAGTESFTETSFVLPGSAADFTGCPDSSPPGSVSPYGTGDGCDFLEGSPRCSDGRDNDGDGLTDAFDPQCTVRGAYAPLRNSESAFQCSDGVDNDGDGDIDQNDSGCLVNGVYQPERDTEVVFNNVFHCSDGIDNDGDNVADADDPECIVNGVYQPNREFESPANLCADGLDNDGDNVIDENDPACGGSRRGVDESPANLCADGVDNDNDNLVDENDPACVDINGIYRPERTTESPANQCADGLDNDGDSVADALDPSCRDSNGNYLPERASEFPANECLDGFDNDDDGLVDADDPGCIVNGVYQPADTSELPDNSP